MEHTSHLELSDYQRAVLTEMGISVWSLANAEQQSQSGMPSWGDVSVSPDAVSKKDALAKLQELKAQNQATETTDAVLVTFSQAETKLQPFSDVLVALELDTQPLKYISPDQIAQYSSYPLSWSTGLEVSIDGSQLITPPIAQMQDPRSKRQLWKVLQGVINID